MGISNRTFLLDHDDRPYWLPVALFEKMLARPAQHRYPQFAGQRVRAAQVLVQLRDRKPSAIARTSFHILAFDADGCFDVAAYLRRNSVAPRWQYRQCWLQQQATRSARLPSSRPARDLRHVVAAGSPRIPYWALSMTRRWASASALDCECEDHSRMRNSLIPCRHRLRLKQRHSNGRGSNCSQHPVRRCVLSAKVAAIRRRPLLHRKAVTPTG